MSGPMGAHRAAIGASARIGCLTVMLLVSGTVACQEVLTYRNVEYSANQGPERTSEWSYPVFSGHWPWGGKRLAALNDWLRTRSLEPFSECAGAGPTSLAGLADKRIVASLASRPELIACGIQQSVLTPVESFGPYLSVRLKTSHSGSWRPQHSIEAVLLDLRTLRKIDLSALFKPGSLEDLNDELGRMIRSTRPDCTTRTFDWTQVSFRPPHTLFIEFPYDPAEWRVCGDGVELLEGRMVERLLLTNRNLAPLRRLRTAD